MSQPSQREMTSAPETPAGMGRPLLSMRDVNVGYGDTQVIWDVSIELRRGEVGASGDAIRRLLCPSPPLS